MKEFNFNSAGLPLLEQDNLTLCDQTDVLRMINHELLETKNPAVRSVLERMKARVTANDRHNRQFYREYNENNLPGRYAIGKWDGKNWIFFVDTDDSQPQEDLTVSVYPCDARLYVNYRSACACAEFMEDDDWQVLDMYKNLPESARWIRRLHLAPDADDGNENAIPITLSA